MTMINDNLREIIISRILKHKKVLFEASLSRIMGHVRNAKTEGFAILTSWRQANDKKTNLAHFQSLQNFVRSRGLGYIQLQGHWQECQDPSVDYENCPPEQLKDSVEPSLMVFKIDQKTAVELGRKFDQDAVVYAGPETDGQVRLHFKDGSTMELGEFNPMAIGQAYSEYRSKQVKSPKPGSLERVPRHFQFEAFSYPAQGFIEKTLEQKIIKEMKIMSEAAAVLLKK